MHFAGEHTDSEFVGCTQAALISGAKTAEKIIGSYVKNYTFFVVMLLILSRFPLNLR